MKKVEKSRLGPKLKSARAYFFLLFSTGPGFFHFSVGGRPRRGTSAKACRRASLPSARWAARIDDELTGPGPGDGECAGATW